MAPEVNSRSRETKVDPHLIPLKHSHGRTELTAQHRINLRPRLLLQSPTQKASGKGNKASAQAPPILTEGTAAAYSSLDRKQLVERASRLRGAGHRAARSGAGAGGWKLAEEGWGVEEVRGRSIGGYLEPMASRRGSREAGRWSTDGGAGEVLDEMPRGGRR